MKIDFKKSATPTEAFLDMLGGGNSDGDIVKLPVNLLTPYPNQKTFRKYPEDKLIDLADNIKKVGILEPVIVRPYEGKEQTQYEILAGHNRTAAAKIAGLTHVPCIIKVVDDRTAKAIFVITNLNQREKLLYSEKAFAYKLLMESEDEGHKGTAEIIAQQNNESRRQIFRYLRLTYLIQPLLDLVDDESLPFMVGVNLSYLNADCQMLLQEYVEANELKIKLVYSEAIKNVCKDGVITHAQLDKIFMKPYKAPKKKTVKLPLNDISSYFPDLDDDEIIKNILDILREHFLDC